MQINWEDAVNQIFSESLSCPRCNEEREQLVTGYSRKPELNKFAPRHRHCARGDECEARKLITLCESCAREERLRGAPADAVQMLEVYMLDCRRDLEETLDYLAEYWRDDFDLSDEELDRPLAEVDPDAFLEESEWRAQLEDEYLRYHKEFRQRNMRIPHPGWRAEFAEEIRALGYDTSLGD